MGQMVGFFFFFSNFHNRVSFWVYFLDLAFQPINSLSSFSLFSEMKTFFAQSIW